MPAGRDREGRSRDIGVNTNKPTIRDVAAAAGVHYATVSRALRGLREVAPATRRCVQVAAARLGYTRDPAFQALCGRRRGATGAVGPQRIALLFNRAPENGFAGFLHYRAVERSVRARATELGYECEVLFVDRDENRGGLLHRHLQRRQIRGLIFAAFEAERPTVDLPWDEYCAVKFDSQQVLPAFTFVSVDQFHYTRLAFRRMRELGYRRIGLAVGEQDEVVLDGRHTAALLLEQAAVPAAERVPAFLLQPQWSTRDATEAIGSWLAAERVDAVISNWTQVWKLVRPYRVGGLRPVASAAMCMVRRIPHVAGVCGDMRAVGLRAVERLAALLQAGRFGVPATATSTHIRGTWCDGATAPPVRLP